MSASGLHLLTINAQGLRDIEKQNRFYTYIKQQKASIIFIQETHLTQEIENKFNNDSKWQSIHCHGSSQSRGVSILIDKKINAEVINIKREADGRALIVNIKINEFNYCLINVYAPNDKNLRNKFLKKLSKLVNDFSDGFHIFGGDWNEIQTKSDRKSKNKIAKPVKNLKKIIKSNKLIDPWELKNPKKIQYTWKRKGSSHEASRIDYFLISNELQQRIINSDIRPAIIKYTDHMAVSLKLNIENISKGPGYWKLNNNLLQDKKYQNLVKQCLSKYNNMSATTNKSKQIIWDLCKLEIKEISIKYGIERAKTKRDKIKSLETELLKCEEDNNINKAKNVENELETLYNEKAKGAQIRSRMKWIEEGEKNTKYFLNLESSRQTKKAIINLYDSNGNVLSKQDQILNRGKEFYSELYHSVEPDLNAITQYIQNLQISDKLNDEDKTNCEGPLTEKECQTAILKMKKNKSPGSDGLSVEFYQAFWNDLKDLVLKSLNTAYETGKLSKSQRKSFLSLMFKKKDPYDINNWRPISLLNVDYKIAAHCLANRIKPILPKIIHTDQNGFIKGRNINYNIRLIQDIIEYSEKQNIEGLILFLDFAKAFDTVEWGYMFTALKQFNFGESFLKWTQTLYNDNECSISNNGWISSPIKVSRGIKQGCPLSSLLFVITVETMAVKIRQEETLKGIKLSVHHKSEFKISQLADDTTLFLKSKKDLTKALNIIEIFGSLSGLVLNREKSYGFQLGKNCDIPDDFERIRWNSKSIKTLGIIFNKNKTEMLTQNWDLRIEKIKSIIKSWSGRQLTMIGKIQVIKSLLIPQITYLYSAIPMPKKYVNTVNKIIYKFLWDGKSEKIKRDILSNSFQNGGLNMINLDMHIKTVLIKWIPKLTNNISAAWKEIPKLYLNEFGENFFIFGMNIDHTKNLNGFKSLPEFYQNIIKAWIEIGGAKTSYPKNNLEILKQPIWGNKYIKFRGKLVIHKSWIKSGIIYMKDLVDNQGKINERNITPKLTDKTNWIAEFTMIKKAIPKEWLDRLQSNTDWTNYQLNIRNIKLRLKHKNKEKNLLKLQNKDIYNILCENNQSEPISYIYWGNTLNQPNIKRNSLTAFNSYFKLLKITN